MVKMNSLASKIIFFDFLGDFRPGIRSIGDFEVDFSLMKKICALGISKNIPTIFLKFLSGLAEVIPYGRKQPFHDFHIRRPSNVLRKKKTRFFLFSDPTLRISETGLKFTLKQRKQGSISNDLFKGGLEKYG